MAASLRLDDQPRAEKTPVLLRGLKPGHHKVVVYKAGYDAQTLDFEVPAAAPPSGKVVVLNLSLAPDSVVALFPANPMLQVAGSSRSTLGLQFRLPAGRWDLTTQGTTVKAEPVFGDEAMLTVAPWVGVGLLSLAAVATVFDAGGLFGAAPTFSPSTAVLWTALGGDLAWWWALADRKGRWEREKVPTFEPVAQEGAEKAEFAGPLAARAGEFLQSGDLANAEALFGRLVRDYPEAVEVPGAWFRLARIHNLKGERELARGEYRLVAETLQDPEWYDRAHRALADLAVADGHYDEALYHLHQLAYADGFFDPADIQAQIDELSALAGGTHAN
jgi:hypothetical protein